MPAVAELAKQRQTSLAVGLRGAGIDQAPGDDVVSRLVTEPVKVAIIPDRPAIIVIANPVDRETIVGFLKALDREPMLAEARMRIVPLRHADASDAPVSLVDVAPTLAELLHVPERADWSLQVEGRSLVPFLRGETLAPVPVFAESGHPYFPHLLRRRVRFDPSGRFRAVILGDHKLIWTPGARRQLRYELYDLAEDPGEVRNLAGQKPGLRDGLAARLRAWLREGDGAVREPSAADLERLRRLGYVE